MNIKELRKKNNLTQEKLAQLVGVSIVTVNRWETGKTQPIKSLEMKLKEVLEGRNND